MKNIHLTILLLSGVLLSSCSSKIKTGNTSPLPTIITPIETTSAIATPPAMPIEQTPSIETTSSAPYVDQISRECIELIDEDITDASTSGILLLQRNEQYSALNLSNLSVSKLTKTPGRIYSPRISPDMRHLLIEVCDDSCNYVLMEAEKSINVISAHNDWALGEWLDNERVLILSLFEPHNIVILNPFTGGFESIQLSLPKPYTIPRGPNENLIPISIAPSLETVLFYSEDLGGRLVAWDIRSGREIASLPYTVDRSVGFGSWSPNGQNYITSSPDNRTMTLNALFSVDRNGKFSRLTNFDQENEFANVTDPVWSPDNEKIAFWLKINTAQNSKPDQIPQFLAIMDISSLETKVLCQTFSTPYYPAFPVFWSLEGTQVITNTRTDKGIVEPVLIDLVRFTRTKIDTQGKWVEGWIAP